MKGTERHHLKENEIQKLAREARELVEHRGRELSWAVLVVVALAIGVLGYFGWRERVHAKSEALVAAAIAVQDARIGPPPAPGTISKTPYFPTERERSEASLARFKEAADAYPSTPAGTFARYQQAAAEMTLGRTDAAVTSYRDVVAKGGDGIYGQMARLGLAEAQTRSGQYDQAIATFRELAQRRDTRLPIDGILMQLGRAYVGAGKPADAQQTFTRLVDEFPESPYTTEAKRELDSLKKG